MTKWTGRYWTNKKISKKISKKLKKYYKCHYAWNKGKIYSKIILKFGNYKRWLKHKRETNKAYYLKDLEQNAKRGFKKRYNDYPERRKRINMLRNQMVKRCGFFKRRVWGKSELDYLQENYKELFIEDMAKHLKRSHSSVVHKLCKLRLLCNHKWL